MKLTKQKISSDRLRFGNVVRSVDLQMVKWFFKFLLPVKMSALPILRWLADLSNPDMTTRLPGDAGNAGSLDAFGKAYQPAELAASVEGSRRQHHVPPIWLPR